MTCVINPSYQQLSDWIRQTPQAFDSLGTIIYNERNTLRSAVAPDGTVMCIKRYRIPIFINRIAYSLFRPSKAQRAYQNGLQIIRCGISTPTPVAYIECRNAGLIEYTYLITEMSDYSDTMHNYSLHYTPDLDDIIRPFARFTANLHDHDILHLDYSPGNILYKKDTDGWHFTIIDINRLKFKHVDMLTGCKNIQRFAADTRFFDIFAEEYALARNFEPLQCRSLILKYRNQFWDNGKRAYYKYE